MTLATYMMTYDQGKWIMRNLENAYEHVDRIYVMHSKLPWGYKPEAREKYTNTVDLNEIKNSKYMDKITLIEGDWLSDTDQRTECLQKAKKDGIDFLMVHDADEFYFHQDFEKIKDIVFNEPTYEVFDMNLYAFWRAFKYRIINHDQSPISGCNQTVVNLHRVNKYDHIRDVHTSNRMVIPEVICYHGSYVLTDEEAWKKINMTSHSNDYDGVKWYNEVWLPWTLDSRNLHPIWPWAWSHCEIYEGELPEPIKDFDKVHML